jgi:hypothetical protein
MLVAGVIHSIKTRPPRLWEKFEVTQIGLYESLPRSLSIAQEHKAADLIDRSSLSVPSCPNVT